MWWSDGRRGRKLDELVEKARTEKVSINSFDPEAMKRRTPCVRNVVVVRGKSVISIKKSACRPSSDFLGLVYHDRSAASLRQSPTPFNHQKLYIR